MAHRSKLWNFVKSWPQVILRPQHWEKGIPLCTKGLEGSERQVLYGWLGAVKGERRAGRRMREREWTGVGEGRDSLLLYMYVHKCCCCLLSFKAVAGSRPQIPLYRSRAVPGGGGAEGVRKYVKIPQGVTFICCSYYLKLFLWVLSINLSFS